MYNLSAILIIILLLSMIFNYLSFDSQKTAIKFVNDMGIGYNLGNTLNWENIIKENNIENEEINLFGTSLPTRNTLKEVKKSGFKTIRFQILYNNNTYSNGKINFEWIKKVKELINMIINLNMYLILSIKHTNEFFNTEGKDSKDKYINFWRQIANELNNYDEHLIFESMYEIGYLAHLNRKNKYFEDENYYLSQDFINIIRDSGGLNTKRLLIIPMISSDYELSFYNTGYTEYNIPKDPFNRIAILIYYIFPSEESSPYYNILEPFYLYDKEGNTNQVFPHMEWGSSRNYKVLITNFNNMKEMFTDKGFPVIIGEFGILNDYIIKNNSIEQLLYTFFSMSYEYEGILPCLWDIPLTSSIHKNFYYNKEKNEWSNWKYQNIFNKISKGNFIKSFDYYYLSNMENEDNSLNGDLVILVDTKKIIKIFVNVRFFIHIDDDFFMSIFSSGKDFSMYDFILYEKEGKRHYDGTSSFTIDAPDEGLYHFVQIQQWYTEDYVIINNITVLYEGSYPFFDHSSYKSEILKEIN